MRKDYNLQCHLVWRTGNGKILNERMIERLKVILMQEGKKRGIVIVKGKIFATYVHLVVVIPADLSINDVVDYLKGVSCKKLKREFGSLKREFKGKSIWESGYLCQSVGKMFDRIIDTYVAKPYCNVLSYRVKIKYVNVVIVILIVFLLMSIIGVTRVLSSSSKIKDSDAWLVERVMKKGVMNIGDEGEQEVYNVSFLTLKSINPDVVAWIMFNRNVINYPVMQMDNNDYYMTHTYDRRIGKSGAIFMDYRNNSFDNGNVVLYGKVLDEEKMFGSLMGLFDGKYDDRELVRIITPEEAYVYRVFSYYVMSLDDDEDLWVSNSDELFLQTIKERSLKNLDVDVSSHDCILTLVGLDLDKSQRLVVHAKRV